MLAKTYNAGKKDKAMVSETPFAGWVTALLLIVLVWSLMHTGDNATKTFTDFLKESSFLQVAMRHINCISFCFTL